MTRLLAGRRSGMPLPGTLGAEAERLAMDGSNVSLSCSDKNEERSLEMISQSRATPLESSDASLVAGNVTGGGGKATTKKT